MEQGLEPQFEVSKMDQDNILEFIGFSITYSTLSNNNKNGIFLHEDIGNVYAFVGSFFPGMLNKITERMITSDLSFENYFSNVVNSLIKKGVVRSFVFTLENKESRTAYTLVDPTHYLKFRKKYKSELEAIHRFSHSALLN